MRIGGEASCANPIGLHSWVLSEDGGLSGAEGSETMDEEHLRRLAVTRLTPSRVGVGDRVILLTAASGPSGSGRVDEDDVDVDRKFGTVE